MNVFNSHKPTGMKFDVQHPNMPACLLDACIMFVIRLSVCLSHRAAYTETDSPGAVLDTVSTNCYSNYL